MELNNLLSALYFAGGIFTVVLMVTFLFEEVKKINFISVVILALLSWWSFGYYIWLSAKSPSLNDVSFCVANLGLILIPITYYLWISVLLDKKRRIIVIIGYIISALFGVFCMFSLRNGMMHADNSSLAREIVFVSYFIFIYIGFYLLTIVELMNSVLSSKNKEEKNVNKNILLILILIFILGILNLRIFYDGAEYHLYSGAISIFLIVFLFVYASIKKNLIDIKMFFAQALIGLILTVNIAEVFFSKSLIGLSYRLAMLLFLFLFANLLIKNYKQDFFQKDKLEKMRKKLEDNNRKLKELDRAKNEFISIAAHQLRTPPTVIKGYLALAKEDPNNNLDVETRDSLSRAFSSNERLIELVEDILNISRIESGKMQYDFKPNQSCEKIVRELKEEFKIKAHNRGLKLKLDISKDGISDITMDSGKIREVISNLLDNAIKYTSKGSIELKLTNTDYDMVRIEIADTGMGISKDEMSNLFKKFSRGSNADQLAAGGIGLGIYVGRKIIEAHKGKVWAESDGLGKGSTFIVELPINQS